eukprot:jgi/Mesvir1/26311/Mv22494-RA.1
MNNMGSSSKLAVIAAPCIAGALYFGYTVYAAREEKRMRVEAFVRRFGSQCALVGSKVDALISEFTQKMKDGLAGKEGSCLRMLPTYVDKLPSGNETGDFYALDVGGSNFRLVKLHLQAGSKPHVTSKELKIPESLMVGDGEELFDFFADSLVAFLEEEKKRGVYVAPGHQPSLGFTFSFPCKQDALNRGELLRWTKGFGARNSEGRDVVEMLTSALKRRKVDMQVRALVNDTVATMAAAAYMQPTVSLAIILGTGTNACYLERMEHVPKCAASSSHTGKMVINMEWGNFDSAELPKTQYDVDIDKGSLNPGEQVFEKMISGMYLGEIARRAIVDLADLTDVFGVPFRVPPGLRYPVFSTPHLAKIMADTSCRLDVTAEVLQQGTGMDASTIPYLARKAVKDICCALSERAVRLVAAASTAILLYGGYVVRGCVDTGAVHSGDARPAGPRPVKDGAHPAMVAVDGGLIKNWPAFKLSLEETLADFLCQPVNAAVKVQIIEDGSGYGAALVAATYSGAHWTPYGR